MTTLSIRERLFADRTRVETKHAKLYAMSIQESVYIVEDVLVRGPVSVVLEVVANPPPEIVLLVPVVIRDRADVQNLIAITPVIAEIALCDVKACIVDCGICLLTALHKTGACLHCEHGIKAQI